MVWRDSFSSFAEHVTSNQFRQLASGMTGWKEAHDLISFLEHLKCSLENFV
jgi:hypothetical protein